MAEVEEDEASNEYETVEDTIEGIPDVPIYIDKDGNVAYGYGPYEEVVEAEEEIKPFSYFDLLDRPRILPEPIDLTAQHLKDIAYELGLIKLCWPEITDATFEDRTHFPSSYTENSNKEKVLLLYTENFRQQFCYKFPNRKPLFLACENECGMQKMVCTTLRPTVTPYSELETWENCAKFVADHIKFEVIDDYPTLLPHQLNSPHTVFLRQRGHSFELATALCSLLLGVGYDAYVVSGYAVKDVCFRVMMRTECPYPPPIEEEENVEETPAENKYTLKPPRDLRSKFFMMMEQRELDKAKAEEEKNLEQQRKRVAEEEKRPPDELEGERVHAWVLVLNDDRKVEDPFFIESSTGMGHPLDADLYLGIESVWNDKNYWVNMQDCSNGLAELKYDLKNTEQWEHLLVGEPYAWRQYKEKEFGEDETAGREMYDEKHLDMPQPWSLKINISHDMLKKRFPDGAKETYFKRTYVEEYAPYVNEDGLVRRVTRFSNFDCSNVTCIEEYFENRHDKLYQSLHDVKSEIDTDYFRRGREDAVIKHIYTKDGPDRTIFFNNQARFDALSKLEVSKEKLTEHYVDREDRLYFRQTVYVTDSAGNVVEKQGNRIPIHKIIQKFKRDPEKKADDDIALQEFNLTDKMINIKFQYGDDNVTASTRTFIKPSVSEAGKERTFDPRLTYGYQADMTAKKPGPLKLYLLFESQLAAEEKALNVTRDIELQISEFILQRGHEMAFSKLDVSLYNKEQNVEHRMAMLEQEEMLRQSKEKELGEEEIDYLAPYLARIGNPQTLTYVQAINAKYACLDDFKQLLVNRAWRIQKQFDECSANMESKQAWYAAHHDTINPIEETAYFEYINKQMFYLHTLDMRLSRHKNLSPLR